MLFETFCAYAILHVVYTCPPENVEEKKCTWVRVTELRNLQLETAAKFRTNAEEFLKSVFALFDFDGVFTSGAKAAAVVRPGVKGYDTQAKAERTIVENCKSFYIKVAVMVGRYLCNKEQDVDFGKAAADNLGTVLARFTRWRESGSQMPLIIHAFTASLYR